MPQLLRVRPTKIELIRLRRRLKTAKRLHKVLKDRLIILSQELIDTVKEAADLRERIHKKLIQCLTRYIDAAASSTAAEIEEYATSRYEEASVVLGTRAVAGIRVPVAELERVERRIAAERFSAALIKAGACFDEIMEDVLRLGELEASIALMGKEVSRVKRRVNALENILIPRMEATIRYLRMKFEEREREDKMRLKKVKELLQKRAGPSEGG